MPDYNSAVRQEQVGDYSVSLFPDSDCEYASGRPGIEGARGHLRKD